MLPGSEGQPVTSPGRAAVDPRERVEAGGVDELQAGEIDNERDPADRSRIEFGVELRPGSPVKRAAKPDDECLSPAF